MVTTSALRFNLHNLHNYSDHHQRCVSNSNTTQRPSPQLNFSSKYPKLGISNQRHSYRKLSSFVCFAVEDATETKPPLEGTQIHIHTHIFYELTWLLIRGVFDSFLDFLMWVFTF